MAVDRTPVLKRCRSLGMEPMYLGIDKKSNRKSTRANRKVSEYGLQLREKQKAELRLDNVIFRLGFARTRREARQIVDHKHVLVNGKSVNIPSYQVKAGDKIEIREKSKSLQRYKDIIAATEGHLVPGWLTADRENLCGEVVEKPNREQIDVPVNETLIVELYSK